MEPKRSPSSTLTAVVELDTGTYEVGNLLWLEFELTGRAVKTGTLDQYLAGVAERAIIKSRDESREFKYLGKQIQWVDVGLEGCLVFGYPGDYQKVARERQSRDDDGPDASFYLWGYECNEETQVF